jgi:hypothetical protein
MSKAEEKAAVDAFRHLVIVRQALEEEAVHMKRHIVVGQSELSQQELSELPERPELPNRKLRVDHEGQDQLVEHGPPEPEPARAEVDEAVPRQAPQDVLAPAAADSASISEISLQLRVEGDACASSRRAVPATALGLDVKVNQCRF